MTPEIAADTGTDLDTDIINIEIQDIGGSSKEAQRSRQLSQ